MSIQTISIIKYIKPIIHKSRIIKFQTINTTMTIVFYSSNSNYTIYYVTGI
ncbi:MAG: hypothetical protein IPM96_00635 [Ignavibacteria bacterium]|nr:hypothetical protein [Ignavibacteria bacterium]